jgi:Flp pilus assembly protein TadD
MAALALKAGRKGDAKRLYREIIGMHPNDPGSLEAYVNLGVFLYGEGQRDEAGRLFNKAMELAGNDSVRREFVLGAVGTTRNSAAGDGSQRSG